MSVSKPFNYEGPYWLRALRNYKRMQNLLRLLKRANREKLLIRRALHEDPTPPQGKTLLQVFEECGMLDDEEECERACIECATMYTGTLSCPTCNAPGEPLNSDTEQLEIYD